MIQITPHMRVLVAIEPVDFRRGIDGIARVCRELLTADPFSGTVYVFRNARGTALKLLVYDGQGFWLCHKRLSAGRFRCWPAHGTSGAARVRAHELSVLIFGGDPSGTRVPPDWRPLNPT
jgi:transposase